MIQLPFIVPLAIAGGSLIGGFILGWCWRSVAFVKDRDCANPAHGKPTLTDTDGHTD